MNIITTVEPTEEPVSLEDMYLFLRLDAEGSPPEHIDDSMLTSQITASRINVEQMTRRAFVQQSVRIMFPRFPTFSVAFGRRLGDDDDFEQRTAYVELPRPPLIAIESVRYYDADNVLQTLATSSYYVTENDLVPRLYFAETFSVPSTYLRADAVLVDYVVGYPPAGSPAEDFIVNVPAPIKEAIKVGVQLLYDQLSPEQRVALKAVQRSLISSYRVHSF